MDRINPRAGAASWRDAPSALVVAHPGHQVRLHGWLEVARPHVFVLTDGSGHSGRPRLDATSRYLAGLGLRPGRVYGQHTDREMYRRLLDHDLGFFVGLADGLAEALSALRVRFVAGDAAEGYNSIHDVCRLVTDAAVEMLRRREGVEAASFDYPVINPPDDCPEELLGESVWLRLDEETFSRKLRAARDYYPELLEEVRASLVGGGDGPMRDYLSLTGAGARGGIEAFRVECLRPVRAGRGGDSEKPFYELHGERQVRAGLYDHVIRYREHIAPVAERLRRHVG